MRLSVSILAVLLLSRSTSSFSIQSTSRSAQRHPSPLLSATNTNNNIVLEPSYDIESAFDNFKIGSARVHRYTLDTAAPGDQTEYVMWYHGRSTQLDEKKTLPPLSTGRIGRAVSNNGLAWEKCTTGSVSEDASDVALGLNNESWWGFDTAHVGLGNVLLPMQTPAVIAEGGIYLMYYMGGSHEETKMKEYVTEDVTLPESMEDAMVAGMNMKIGVALSQDGGTWGRVEGDDPTGACIVPTENEMYCAWPDVVVNLEGKPDENFRMYYSTMKKDTKEKCIACAVSEDGFRWRQMGVCLAPSADTLDNVGCARCCVVQDAVFEDGAWTVVENSWKMYYEGVSSLDKKHRIMMAESRDGFLWEKIGVALDIGGDEAWDAGGVGSPHCIRYVKQLQFSSKKQDMLTSTFAPKYTQIGRWLQSYVLHGTVFRRKDMHRRG